MAAARPAQAGRCSFGGWTATSCRAKSPSSCNRETGKGGGGVYLDVSPAHRRLCEIHAQCWAAGRCPGGVAKSQELRLRSAGGGGEPGQGDPNVHGAARCEGVGGYFDVITQTGMGAPLAGEGVAELVAELDRTAASAGWMSGRDSPETAAKRKTGFGLKSVTSLRIGIPVRVVRRSTRVSSDPPPPKPTWESSEPGMVSLSSGMLSTDWSSGRKVPRITRTSRVSCFNS